MSKASTSKTTTSKAAVLKGSEAEDRVLEYIKRMNRPYGAVDVSANLKGAVPKTAAQKILAALAERGELVQKTYGKTTFFAPNQDKTTAPASDALAVAEKECTDLEDANKALAAELKAAQAELARTRSAPSDAELADLLASATARQAALLESLTPLRAGAKALSADELKTLDQSWDKWRGEWVHRRRVFNNFWGLVADGLPPQDAEALKEDLGIEPDSDAHTAVDKSALCVPRRGR